MSLRTASALSSRGFICRQCRQQSRARRDDLDLVKVRKTVSRRTLTTSSRFCDANFQSSQAQPLGDFYTDLLAKPIPKASKATSSLPTFVRSGDETKEERARKLFGDIKGSGYERHTLEKPDATWQTINGVPVPPRPAEPDNCCMSGCVNCVWDDYRIDIENWASRVHEAQAKGIGTGSVQTPKLQMPRPEVAGAAGSMDDDGGGSEGLWTSPSSSDEGEALFSGIPIGIREFMANEKRIRERKRRRKEAKG